VSAGSLPGVPAVTVGCVYQEFGYEDWVVAVFDPAADDPYVAPAQALSHLTRLFNDPVPVLEPFTDDEIGAGLWSVLDSGGSAEARSIGDVTLPIDDRIAGVESIRTLYRALFVPRCAGRLGHLSEQGGRLEMVCYMFWDIAAFAGVPGEREGNLLEDAVLDVLEDLLYIEHLAVQESALHGLGHRCGRQPERVARLIQRWRKRLPVSDERLRAYAAAAETGCVL
jgi:hypothetical protein